MKEAAVSDRSRWVAVAVLSMLLSACGGASEERSATTEQSMATSIQEDPGADTAATERQEALADVDKEPAESKTTSPQNVTGFAARFAVNGKVVGVTGGAGANANNVVKVTTAADLQEALCNKSLRNGNYCSDDTKRIIQVEGVIDMTDKPEARRVGDGCRVHPEGAVCNPPQKLEAILTLHEWEKGHCEADPRYPRRKIVKERLTYSPAAMEGLLVGSNKTIIGLGKGAGLKGRGLLLTAKVSNIIIRNLSFTDINSGLVFGGDAIKLFDASGVWIDHNYFARIGRQMISTSAGQGSAPASTDVTISNNEFDGRNEYSSDCSGKSYWGLLLAGSDRVTLVGNWMHDFGGRWPKLDAERHASVVHMVNNLFENSSERGSALQYAGAGLRVFAEGNYFDKVADPVANIDHHGAQLFGVYSQTPALKGACTTAIGRLCSGNIAVPADNDGTLVQDTAALRAMTPYRDTAALVKAYPARDVPVKVRANAGVGKMTN